MLRNEGRKLIAAFTELMPLSRINSPILRKIVLSLETLGCGQCDPVILAINGDRLSPGARETIIVQVCLQLSYRRSSISWSHIRRAALLWWRRVVHRRSRILAGIYRRSR